MLNQLYSNVIKKLLGLNREYKKIILILLDFFIFFLISILSFFLRLENLIFNSDYFYQVSIISIIFSFNLIVICLLFNLYNQITRFNNVNLLKYYILISSTFLISSFIFKYLILFDLIIPRSVPFIIFIFLNFYLLIRNSLLLKLINYNKDYYSKKIVIFGITNNINEIPFYFSGTKVIAYVDNNPNFVGSYINGSKVFDIGGFIKKFKKTKIDIALINSYNNHNIHQILFKNKLIVDKIINIEDIIYNKFVNEDINSLILKRNKYHKLFSEHSRLFENKNILITGVGGSIGSEVFKNIYSSNFTNCNFILIDQNEYGLYKIKKYIQENNSQNNKVQTFLLDLKNFRSLTNIFKEHSIDIIYHAAAYKHVNIVEESQNANFAFCNNILITNILAKLSNKFKVNDFVLISSDKAVEPTNIMGLSKRVSELIIKNLSISSFTNYKVVRFGNVIGSSGSVINNFMSQFEKGGPLTLTHKEVERYFMTINEAANLVIETIAHGSNGDILFLDMGKPIKIINVLNKLAKEYNKIIVSRNAITNNEIELKVIGLGKGEKLEERLFYDFERDISKSKNKKINIIKSLKKYNHDIDKLIDDAINNNNLDFNNIYKIIN